MMTTVEIVCVGNELLIGKVVNTNASWLGKRATYMGAKVVRITVAPDDVNEMAQVFRETLARKPRFVVSTGGLGPTFDDKTLEGVARALNRKLEINEQALRMVKTKYKAYSKTHDIPEAELTPARVKMATLPEGTMPLANPAGTAPGVLAKLAGTVLIVLPGVPREMEAIFEDSVVPLLRKASGDVGFFEFSIYADEIMESVLAPLIDKVMFSHPGIYVKSHPKGRENVPHMELHLSTTGKPSEHPEKQLRDAGLELAGLIEQSGGKVVKASSDVNI